MPIQWKEHFARHISGSHNEILEQNGHFYYNDGFELSKDRVISEMSYNKEICEMLGVPVNNHLQHRPGSDKRREKQITPDTPVMRSDTNAG